MKLNEKLIKAVDKMKKLNVYYKILDLGGIARTTDDVANLYDVNPREIVKTLMIKTDDGRVLAVMLPGLMRIDSKKLLKELNVKKVRFLNEEELANNVNFEPGEVCPILIDKHHIIVDKTVFETEKINVGSGDLYFGIEFYSKDLLKIIDARTVDIIEK